MKKFNLALLAIALLFVGQKITYAQTTAGSVEYMEGFMSANNAIKEETWKYLKAVTRGKGARKVEAKRQKLIKQIVDAKTEVSSKGSFNGDATFKNIVKDYYTMSITVLKEDFDKILDMEDISEQSYDAMEAYLLAKEKANEKLNEAFEKLVAGQKAFAEANKITLVEGATTKRDAQIEQSSNVLAYYNKVYLIFFKVYKQEMYVLDALGRQDISAFEQNNETLESDARKALEKINALEDFEGNSLLKSAVKNISDFYIQESSVDFKVISDFYLKKDQYEKVKKNFDAIKPKSRTQEDIDAMNEAGKEYNDAVAKYNKVNESLNKQRAAYLEQWNKKVESFFDKYAA